MKNFLALAACLLLFAAIAGAQSGRRIKAAPTPEPRAAEPVDEYSESKPQPKRILPRSMIRGSADQVAVSSKAPAPDGPPIQGDEEIVKVETNLVTIPVSVYDRNGLYIADLRQADFKIFEDGKEQEIAYFGRTDKPITVVLLLDTSPSTEYRIEEIRSAASAFVDQLQPEDTVMVIEFDANVHVLTEPTRDRRVIHKAISEADMGGGTSLYDAVAYSLGKRLSQIQGRKAIVLFTDGVDTTSGKSSYDSTLGLAEESDSLIFPIYYNTLSDMRGGGVGYPPVWGQPDIFGIPRVQLPSREDYALGKKYLDDLASYTGGRVFRPESTPGGLTAAFVGIAEELRRQYNIGFIPSDDAKVGQRKVIKVRVARPKVVVRARDSYIVGAQAQPKAAPQTPAKKT